MSVREGRDAAVYKEAAWNLVTQKTGENEGKNDRANENLDALSPQGLRLPSACLPFPSPASWPLDQAPGTVLFHDEVNARVLCSGHMHTPPQSAKSLTPTKEWPIRVSKVGRHAR